MKYCRLLIAVAISLTFQNISAQTISVNDVKMKTGRSSVIAVNFEGLDNGIAAGFSLEIPNGGFLLNTSDISSGVALDNILLPDHVAVSNQLNDTKTKYAIYSPTNCQFRSFENSAGGDVGQNMLCFIQVVAPNTPGTYPCRLTNIEYATIDNELITLPDVSFNINVVQRGDVNFDGLVTVSDPMSLVKHILGQQQTTIDMDSGDVNDDGNITISDVMEIVNIILGRSAP